VIRDSICYMCTATCPVKVQVSDGRATGVAWGDPALVNACPRWKAMLDFVYHPDRLRYPLRRTGRRASGDFQRVSWDEALDTIAENLQKAKQQYGPESVAFWVAYTKEPRPYFHRLTHAFGSPNYCTESSSCFTATRVAASLTYGPDFELFNFSGLRSHPATRCKVIWGNTVQNSAPLFWQSLLAARENGLKLIIVDPRRTEIAAKADIHLQLRPGTDGALALAMLHVIINEDLYDKEFVENWTVGFDGLKKLVRDYPPERAEEITRVPAHKIREAAILYASSKPAQLGLSGNSTTHHTNGVQNHRAIILLPAITGNFDVTGGNKCQPAFDQKNDITLHERIEKMPPGVGSQRFPIWTGYVREMQTNTLIEQIENGKPYAIKALFSSGLNVQFFANSERMVKLVEKLDFIAVTDYFETAASRLADIVLPIASWLERQILVTEPELVKLVQPAIAPVGESWPEWNIYSELAKRLGFGDLFWNGDFEKCVDHILQPSRITYADLKKHPEGQRLPGTARPDRYYEKTGLTTPSGKVEIASSVLAEHGLEPLPVYREPAESPLSRPDLAGRYPLVMTSGARVLAYTHSQFRNIPRLHRLMPYPLIDINPVDAAARGILSGDEVIISTPRASIKMKARVTNKILSGVVSMPHHWPGEANANSLVDDVNLDPISGFPAFKSQLCQVVRT
jgi:anaerobic selenocysteine-containing dehydrogenase